MFLKTIVRGVVKEELGVFGKSFKREMREEITDLFDESFTKYRNETVNKLDKVIGELNRGYGELTIHTGRHDRTEERLDKLEAIHPQGRHQ